MKFQHFPPSTALEPLVAYFWTLSSDKEESKESYRFIPDGYVDWIFHLSEPWAYHIPAKERQKQKYTSHIFGQVKTYMELTLPKENIVLFGAKFNPWTANQIWNMPLNEFTDYSVSLKDLPDKELIFLEERIQEANNTSNRIKILETYILKRIRVAKLKPLEPIIREIEKNPLCLSLSDYTIKKRRLEQRFKTEIGISPKLFQRTIRINEIIKRLIQQPKTQLTQLAYEYNFYDQSHFISDFKKFTGCSPSAFLKAIKPDGDIYNLKI